MSNDYEKGAGKVTRLKWDERSKQLSTVGDKNLGRGIQQALKIIEWKVIE